MSSALYLVPHHGTASVHVYSHPPKEKETKCCGQEMEEGGRRRDEHLLPAENQTLLDGGDAFFFFDAFFDAGDLFWFDQLVLVRGEGHGNGVGYGVLGGRVRMGVGEGWV